MGELPAEGEIFHVDESHFTCLVCGEEMSFDFEEGGAKLEPGELTEGAEEDIGTEEFPSLEDGDLLTEAPELRMKVTSECGAEYLVMKQPGVSGFLIKHLIESEPELTEKKFEEDTPPE